MNRSTDQHYTSNIRAAAAAERQLYKVRMFLHTTPMSPMVSRVVVYKSSYNDDDRQKNAITRYRAFKYTHSETTAVS